MSRITDKIIRPLPLPGESKGPEQPRQRELPLPPGARVASTTLTAVQRAENQRLIALYHSLKEKKATQTASQDFEAQLKGWKKRPTGKKKRQDQQAEDDTAEQDKQNRN